MALRYPICSGMVDISVDVRSSNGKEASGSGGVSTKSGDVEAWRMMTREDADRHDRSNVCLVSDSAP